MTKGYAHRLVIHLTVLALLAVLVGKFWFNTDASHLLLYAYGLAVTLVLLATFGVALFLYRDPYQIAATDLSRAAKDQPLVTCMVAVKDDENVIGRCVESLIQQTYPRKEIIVVNDASVDRTATVLAPYTKYDGVQILHLRHNVGKKKALAEAIKRARGSLFVFTDSDSVLAPDAVAKLVAIFRHDSNVGAVSGHCRALNGDANLLTQMQDAWYEGQFAIRKAFESYFGAATCVSGPLAAFRREAIFNYIPAWTHDRFLGQDSNFATDRTLTGFVLGSPFIGPQLKRSIATMRLSAPSTIPRTPGTWSAPRRRAPGQWSPDTFSRLLKQQVRWKKSFIATSFLPAVSTGGSPSLLQWRTMHTCFSSCSVRSSSFVM